MRYALREHVAVLEDPAVDLVTIMRSDGVRAGRSLRELLDELSQRPLDRSSADDRADRDARAAPISPASLRFERLINGSIDR